MHSESMEKTQDQVILRTAQNNQALLPHSVNDALVLGEQLVFLRSFRKSNQKSVSMLQHIMLLLIVQIFRYSFQKCSQNWHPFPLKQVGACWVMGCFSCGLAHLTCVSVSGFVQSCLVPPLSGNTRIYLRKLGFCELTRRKVDHLWNNDLLQSAPTQFAEVMLRSSYCMLLNFLVSGKRGQVKDVRPG